MQPFARMIRRGEERELASGDGGSANLLCCDAFPNAGRTLAKAKHVRNPKQYLRLIGCRDHLPGLISIHRQRFFGQHGLSETDRREHIAEVTIVRTGYEYGV